MGPVRIPDSFNTLCTVNIILDIHFLEFVALTLPLNGTSQTYFGWEKSFVPQATQSSSVFASGPTDDLASPLVVTVFALVLRKLSLSLRIYGREL